MTFDHCQNLTLYGYGVRDSVVWNALSRNMQWTAASGQELIPTINKIERYIIIIIHYIGYFMFCQRIVHRQEHQQQQQQLAISSSNKSSHQWRHWTEREDRRVATGMAGLMEPGNDSCTCSRPEIIATITYWTVVVIIVIYCICCSRKEGVSQSLSVAVVSYKGQI